MLARCFPVWLFSMLILVAHASLAEQVQQRFIGTWDNAVISLVMQNSPEGDIAGRIDETWIDSAGQQRRGTAELSGIRQADGIDFFLRPKSFVTLPFALHAQQGTGQLAPAEMRLSAGPHATILQSANETDYQHLLSGLTPSALAPAMPIPATTSLAEIEQAGLDGGDGCQCSAEKKTRVAINTADFATSMSHLLAALNDLASGTTATHEALIFSRKATLSPIDDASDEAGADPRVTDWRGMTTRVLLGRRSLDAFDRMYRDAGHDIGSDLTGAAQRCSQRELAAGDVVTPEGKLWRETCLSVARGLDLYRAKLAEFSDDTSATESPTSAE